MRRWYFRTPEDTFSFNNLSIRLAPAEHPLRMRPASAQRVVTGLLAPKAARVLACSDATFRVA
jgi:hypothetical protein